MTQNKLKQLKKSPGLVTSYDLRPGNGVGLFSKGKDKLGKTEEKRIHGEANDINKQRYL